jgi:hypothetical protein
MRTQREVADYFTRKADELTGTGRGLFSLGQSPIETLYQDDQRPGDAAIKTADVVEIDPTALVDDNNQLINIKKTGELRKWLLKRFEGVQVTITDDGTIQEFTEDNLKASLKRRGVKQRQAYAQLDSLLEKAVYDDFEKADAEHPNVKGQNIYYAAAKIGKNYYAVRFKVDIPLDDSKPSYKDHKISEIEIAPALYAEINPPAALPEGNPSAISRISLPVLKRDVNPSRIDLGTLYQSAYHGGPHRFDRFSLDAIDSGEGAQIHGWGIYALRGDTEERKAYADERYRKRLLDKAGITINPSSAAIFFAIFWHYLAVLFQWTFRGNRANHRPISC